MVKYNYMFSSKKKEQRKVLSHSGRSVVGETLQIEGDIRSPGAVDVAGLVNGNVYVSEMKLFETGSIRGNLEASKLEVDGHIEGKIIGDSVILGKNAVVKGDIFFRSTLKTEEGADIDGYIKRLDSGKSKSEEEIDIEEITQRPQTKEPKFAVHQRKEAV